MATKKGNESIDDQAFRALENALRIDFDELKSSLNDQADPDAPPSGVPEPVPQPTRAERRDRDQKARDVKARAAAPAPAAATERRAETRAAAEPAPKSPSFAAANDDSRRSNSALLRAFDVRQGRRPMRMAAIVSIVWLVGTLGIANTLFGSELWSIRSLSDLSAAPGAIGVMLAAFLPMAVFFLVALLVARVQELRTAARSMAEVALRLSEPETIAADRVMSVGQAVRREVSAMNEGIERTIARATELEALVHSEVNALERSYSDNELRVRALVQELGWSAKPSSAMPTASAPPSSVPSRS